MVWFKRTTPFDKGVIPPVRKKGFQVGDMVVVVRFPNDGAKEVEDAVELYGRFGTVTGNSGSMVAISFEGWGQGWNTETGGDNWYIDKKNLRRVTKIDQR